MAQHFNNEIEGDPFYLRLFWSIVYMLVWSLLEGIVIAIFCVQFFASIFLGGPVSGLSDLGHQLGLFIASIVNYLTYTTNEKPFPFSNWPSN